MRAMVGYWTVVQLEGFPLGPASPLNPRKRTSAVKEDHAAHVAKRDAKSLSNFAAGPVGEASNCSLLPKTDMAATNAPRESSNGVATAEIPGSRWPEWDARCAD